MDRKLLRAGMGTKVTGPARISDDLHCVGLGGWTFVPFLRNCCSLDSDSIVYISGFCHL